MDMHKKTEQRKNKVKEVDDRKTNINWFPGHMTKAKREIEANLKVVDMVIELRDARIPLSSKNPMIESIIQNKPRLIVLTKKDKADKIQTERWLEYLSSDQIKTVAIDNFNDNSKKLIINHSKELMKAMIDRMIRKGIKPRAIRAMVVGIPNVGKSTLINRIVSRKIAVTADRPGVTKALKWVKLNSDLELLDTPGVLWPKFDDYTIGRNLAIVGSINDNILPLDELCYEALKIFKDLYPNRINERYGVSEDKSEYDLFNDIAIKRKWLISGNEIDVLKSATIILNEIRDGKLGEYTLEWINNE